MRKEKVFEETVAYKIKNVADIKKIRKAIGSENTLWSDDKLKAFAKGSYISDCVRKSKVLTKYYNSRVRKYQVISLSKAIILEECISFLTDPDSTIHRKKHEIKFLDEDGKVHPKSRELFVAIGELKRFHDRIQKIINSEK